MNSGAVVCLGSPDTDDVDGRLIYPGSTGISIRYIAGCTVGAPESVELTGALYPAGLTVALKCALATGGGTVFDSATIPLPAGGQGCVTATMINPDLEGTNTTYHTLGATC